MSEKPLISFDYAIKYLLKNKGDHDIVEGFISALLKAKGYGPVKINALLESESNKEIISLKKSIADLIVEDAQGNKYIVEIEREYAKNFMHKACFNTSRLIVDSISTGEDYTTIKKVFHISLLYFNWVNMQRPLCHGKTIFHEIDTQHPLDVHMTRRNGEKIDLSDILPEYFIITVPLFDDIIKQEIDEWLYVMKHERTKEDFKSPCMKKVAERLNVHTFNAQEKDAYYRYMKETLTQRDVLISAEEKGLEKGLQQGLEKGIEKGREEERRKIAKELNKLGASLEMIQKATGFSDQEVSKILEDEDVFKRNP